MELLNHNTLNRPLDDNHVKRIANQIVSGKWRFNGDTIKISHDQRVLDGQHRLWAVVEAKVPVETIIVHGIENEAFATIDTLRKPRSGADILAKHYNYQVNGGYKIFWNFIGADFHLLQRQASDGKWTWTLPNELAERVMALNSPHYVTIIKAMEARGAKIDLTLCSHW